MKINELVRNMKQICETVTFKYVGNDAIEFDGLNLCNRKTICDEIMTYVVNDELYDVVANNRSVKVLILPYSFYNVYEDEIVNRRNGGLLLCDDPEYLFYTIHEYLYNNTDFYKKFDFESKIGNNCKISDSVYIEDGVIIGNRVTIGHNTTIKHGVVIEDDVVIGCNTVIGSEGFQAIQTSKGTINITHVGGCLISKGVTIGDNNCVCNSLFEGFSFIGENVKTDNMVHIAHNSYIEKDVVLTAGVTLCGSVTIKEGAWIAPNTSILNKVVVGKRAKTGLGSVVIRNIPDDTMAYGVPAKNYQVSK